MKQQPISDILMFWYPAEWPKLYRPEWTLLSNYPDPLYVFLKKSLYYKTSSSGLIDLYQWQYWEGLKWTSKIVSLTLLFSRASAEWLSLAAKQFWHFVLLNILGTNFRHFEAIFDLFRSHTKRVGRFSNSHQVRHRHNVDRNITSHETQCFLNPVALLTSCFYENMPYVSMSPSPNMSV